MRSLERRSVRAGWPAWSTIAGGRSRWVSAATAGGLLSELSYLNGLLDAFEVQTGDASGGVGRSAVAGGRSAIAGRWGAVAGGWSAAEATTLNEKRPSGPGCDCGDALGMVEIGTETATAAGLILQQDLFDLLQETVVDALAFVGLSSDRNLLVGSAAESATESAATESSAGSVVAVAARWFGDDGAEQGYDKALQ